MSFRINKCIVGYSRRQADTLLANGRVKVNGKVTNLGVRIGFGDNITVDNQPIEWENYVKQVYANPTSNTNSGNIGDNSKGNGKSSQRLFSKNDGFLYMKMWKPMNTITTTAGFDKDSILRYLYQQQQQLPPNDRNRTLLPLLDDKKNGRIFPVGRLDKDTTGVILLTSNPRFQYELLGNKRNKVIVNDEDSGKTNGIVDEEDVDEDDVELDLDLLSFKNNDSTDSRKSTRKQPQNRLSLSSSMSYKILSSNLPFYEKVYEVTLDKPASQEALDAWRTGMVITSSTTSRKKIVSPTLPCSVIPIESSIGDFSSSNSKFVYQFTLHEGRNRQLHRMTNAFGYEIEHIHRTKFCQITLEGLKKPGDWKVLSEDELNRICDHVQR